METTEKTIQPTKKGVVGFQAYLFLLAAEREYQWLLRKLGYDECDVDLRAFQMTQKLAEHRRYMDELWQSVNKSATNTREG